MAALPFPASTVVSWWERLAARRITGGAAAASCFAQRRSAPADEREKCSDGQPHVTN
jgi:hypothetical protein